MRPQVSHITQLSQSILLAPAITAGANNPSESNLRNLNLEFKFSVDPTLRIKSALCRLDSNAATDCSSGTFALSNMADGDHTITISLTDTMDQKAQDLSVLLRIDATAPVITVSQPPPAVSGAAVALAFSASDALSAPVTLECSLDAAAFAACASPVNLNNLAAGARSFKVRAKDRLGNAAESALSWTVDLAAPVVTITGMPPAVTSQRTAAFMFSGTLTGTPLAAFQCSLGNAAFATCASPANYANLADGNHTFRVAGRDNNNQFLNPVSCNWRVDTVQPSVPVITASVGADSNLTAAQFSFSATDTGAGIGKFQCSLDAAAFADCASPLSVSNLAQGQHTLNVRAHDAAGNMSTNGTFSWRIDTVIPVITISSAPPPSTLDKTASFVFSVSETGSGLAATECQLDNGAFAACTSPHSLTNLTAGSRTVRIRARDRAGNQGMTAHSWVVESAPLDGKILYANKCASCHGALASSSKMGRSAAQIQTAINTIPAMNSLAATTAAEIQAIAAELAMPPPVQQQAKFQCTEPLKRGNSQTHMLRLSKSELVNTISDIYGAALAAGLTSLVLFPDDVIQDHVTDFNNSHAATHIEAIFNTGLSVAQNLTSNRAMLNALAPACVGQGIDSGSLADTCVNQFISSLGPKMHRRPLSAAQSAAYLSLYKTTDANAATFTAKDRVELLIAAFFQAPEFIFHWNGTTGAADQVSQRIAVDAYTVANRLAFQMTGFPPDQTLYNAAAAGQLSSLAQVQAQAARLLDSARGRTKVRGLFYHWLRLHKTYPANALALARAGLPSDNATQNRLIDEMVKETLDFAEHIVFNQNGTFSDLFLSNLSFPQSAEMAKILGLPPAARGATASTDSRAGLSMRPAVIGGTGSEREAPINRGIRIRTRVLCETVPPPPADADDVAADVLTSIDRTMHTTREIAGLVTASPACISCHSFLNPPGYALGSFGPIGEFRTLEKVYDAAGALKNQFPIDSKVTSGLNIVSSADQANNHTELAQLIANSTKAQGCFAQYAFRASRVRFENAQDNCNLAEVEAQLTQKKPVKSALIQAVAAEDIFWKGLPK